MGHVKQSLILTSSTCRTKCVLRKLGPVRSVPARGVIYDMFAINKSSGAYQSGSVKQEACLAIIHHSHSASVDMHKEIAVPMQRSVTLLVII